MIYWRSKRCILWLLKIVVINLITVIGIYIAAENIFLTIAKMNHFGKIEGLRDNPF